MSKINVAIADDNQKMVSMMTQLLNLDQEIEVIGSAGNGEAAVEIIKEKKPDVVLLDVAKRKVYAAVTSGDGHCRNRSFL